MSKKIIIGFAGEMGCGKDTATDYIFKKLGGEKLKFSQVLRDVLTRIGAEHSRENIAKMSTLLRQGYGQDRLAIIIAKDVSGSDENVILIDGVRREDDIVHLRKNPDFKLVYMDTSIENRFQRISIRGENADDIGKTFEQFQIEQQHEAEVQIRGLKEKADYVIDNNGSFEDLYEQIDSILEELK